MANKKKYPFSILKQWWDLDSHECKKEIFCTIQNLWKKNLNILLNKVSSCSSENNK